MDESSAKEAERTPGVDSRFRDLLDDLDEGIFLVDRDRTVGYWSKGLERFTGLSSAEVLGRRCSDDVLTCVDAQGDALCERSCPVFATVADGVPRVALVRIPHREGRRLAVLLRTLQWPSGDGHCSGAVGILRDASARMVALSRSEELRWTPRVDPGTGLANKHLVRRALRARLDEMPRYGWIFAFLLVAVDNFERVKPLQHDEARDQTLQTVARILLDSSRSFDVVGRWQEGLFACIVKALSQSDDLTSLANRLRLLVERSTLEAGLGVVPVTVSIGATLARPYDDVEALLDRAGTLLGRGRTLGPNRVFADL